MEGRPVVAAFFVGNCRGHENLGGDGKAVAKQEPQRGGPIVAVGATHGKGTSKPAA